jgi:hypothetical protein
MPTRWSDAGSQALIMTEPASSARISASDSSPRAGTLCASTPCSPRATKTSKNSRDRNGLSTCPSTLQSRSSWRVGSIGCFTSPLPRLLWSIRCGVSALADRSAQSRRHGHPGRAGAGADGEGHLLPRLYHRRCTATSWFIRNPKSTEATSTRSVLNVYDEAERHAEAAAKSYHRAHSLPVRIERIFNAYGPRDATPGRSRILAFT